MRVLRRTLSERGGSASDAGCLTRSDWDMPSEMTAMPKKLKLLWQFIQFPQTTEPFLVSGVLVGAKMTTQMSLFAFALLEKFFKFRVR